MGDPVIRETMADLTGSTAIFVLIGKVLSCFRENLYLLTKNLGKKR